MSVIWNQSKNTSFETECFEKAKQEMGYAGADLPASLVRVVIMRAQQIKLERIKESNG